MSLGALAILRFSTHPTSPAIGEGTSKPGPSGNDAFFRWMRRLREEVPPLEVEVKGSAVRLARIHDASQKGTKPVAPTPNRQSWFEPLVVALERPALAFALMLVRDRSMAEEIVQEAFARVWSSPKTPQEAAEFRRWLYRAISNLAYDQLRRQARFTRLRLWLAPPKNPLDVIDQWVEDQGLVQTLRRLSRREQLAVYLLYYEDRPFEEVDRFLGTRPGSARKLVSRTLQKLRRQLTVDAAGEPS